MTRLHCTRHRLSASCLGLVALFLVASCGKHGLPTPTGGSTVPPSQTRLQRNVELDRASQQALLFRVETVGYIEAEAQTDIAAGASGIVDEVLFREGQWVDQNSTLVRIDQPRYQSAAEVARANERRAEANVSLARDISNRARQAGRGVSEEDRSKALLGLRVAEAEAEAARAARLMAEHNLSRSVVKAPYPGQINQRKVTLGMFVEDKSVIATIADLRHLRLVAWVPEKAAPTVREQLGPPDASGRAVRAAATLLASLTPWGPLVAGAPGSAFDAKNGDFALEFTLNAFPRRTFKARVFYLSTVASPDTHMFECKAEVDMHGLDVELKPGLSARVRVPLRTSPNACVVPEEAVRASERGFIAFVPVLNKGRDGKDEWVARAREVKDGHRPPGFVEILHGIEPGEWIVRRGAESLEDGTPIRIPDAQLKELNHRSTESTEKR